MFSQAGEVEDVPRHVDGRFRDLPLAFLFVIQAAGAGCLANAWA